MRSSWSFVLLRNAILCCILLLVIFSQRFWFLRARRLANRIRAPRLRKLWQAVISSALILVCFFVVGSIIGWRHRTFGRGSWFAATGGLWLLSALFAYLAIQLVAALDWIWGKLTGRPKTEPSHGQAQPVPHALADPSRRYFFHTATCLAGALPFVGALYGFAAERLRYRFQRVEVPIPDLPPALDGMRIVQLSDIHSGGYMPIGQVRRAVEMANGLSAELAVVTGDFITGPTDPLEECIRELSRLQAPLGIWGCNGNHEIYADVEEYAAELFRRSGMRLLRRENVELARSGQRFNLIGVDYQRSRASSGRRPQMLSRVEPLVRRDVPNILLSHNPNAFLRAAELGIELTLAGHTHGGQVQVEILDRRWSPARFITDFIAGLYQRTLGGPAQEALHGPSGAADVGSSTRARTYFLYVNRGLGTVGAPVRINVPPEITLLTLRRAG